MDTDNKPAFGVTYEFKIAKYFKEKYGPNVVKNISLPESVPSDSPKNLKEVEINSNTIRVSWDAPDHNYHNGIIILYQVRYYDVRNEEKSERMVNATGTSVELSDLVSSEYKIFVQAFTKVGAGMWSNPLYYSRPNVQDLPVPVNVRAARKSPTELEISWSVSEISDKVKGYLIFYSSTMLLNPKWQKYSTTNVDLKANIRGLSASSSYQVKVAAVDSRGLNGNFSRVVADVIATIPSLDSRTVKNLRCSVIDSKMLTLEWQAPIITADIIRFEIFYSANLTYISSMNLKMVEVLKTMQTTQSFEPNVEKYFQKLDNLQSNALYTITVRTIYGNNDQSNLFQSLLETNCRTNPAAPDFVDPPIPSGVVVGQNQVKLKLFRCTERKGPLSKYILIVGIVNPWDKNRRPSLKDPTEYSLIELGSNTRTKNYTGPYIALSKNVNSLFERRRQNYTEIILGQEHINTDINDGLTSNKQLESHLHYKVFARVCIEVLYGDQICKSSNWSQRFNIEEMLNNKDMGITGLSKMNELIKESGDLNYTILLTVLLTGVIIAVLCVIVGCVIIRKKWSNRLTNTGNLTSSGNHGDSSMSSSLLKKSVPNGIRTSDKCLSNLDMEIVNNHSTKYSTTPDLVAGDSMLMCQNGSKLSSILLNGSARNRFSNYRSESKEIPDKAPIPVLELYQYISELKANDGALLHSEFETLNTNLDDRFSWQRSNIDSNKNKNRYANVVAYDHTSVLLQSLDDIIGSDYINANYIDGYHRQKAYIATQGPLPDTTDDFWRMVWEQNSTAIVMMTRLEEKSGVKCHQYWPNRGFICYGQMIVCFVESFLFAYYTIRIFELRHSKFGEKREIHHFQFTAWPDHGVPKLSTPLLMFIRRFRSLTKVHSGATVVHCSAGVGRTGAFIVIDTQLERIKHEKTVDLVNYISKIRCQRNYMVQTQAQYLFILETLLEAVEDGNTEVAACNLYSHVTKLSQIGHSGSNELSGFELEFSKLNSLASNRDRHGMMLVDFVKAAGNQPVNLTKNKIRNIIPYDWNRVILPAIRGIDGSDYINASYIDGYRDRRAYIAAQSPLASSVEDFWRMIWDQHCGVIVVLNQPQEEKCHVYWPMHKSIRYQFFVVDPVVEYNMPNYILREFKVTDARDGEFRTLRQFQFTQWSCHGCPKESESILDFIRQVHKTKEQFGHMEPMIVHCSSGSGRTGVFIALSIVIDRLQQESVIDMYQTVKLLHKQRLGLVQTEEQYEFCYKAVIMYLTYFEKNENNCAHPST